MGKQAAHLTGKLALLALAHVVDLLCDGFQVQVRKPTSTQKAGLLASPGDDIVTVFRLGRHGLKIVTSQIEAKQPADQPSRHTTLAVR
jgi:hypothetical protein